ncbi:hypothetical protein [Halogranum rubrum]|uniref:Uncharacterized protein n=1 Tax=Halogranum salarium B-1 TaxID=1210908 RepID=J3JGD7_9EURY|nr:hypothetical protein [Halogranum salarium]EJN60011.1 hypothetical protein HSB1_21690 [Halogranum salarium B-1]
MGKQTEQCGRCAMSSVVDFTENGGDEDEEASTRAARADRNPFGGDRIEVDDDELRATSPAAWLGGLTSRLDDVATRVIYGR